MTPRWLLDELLDDPKAWFDYAACLGIYDEYDTKDIDNVLFPFNPKLRDGDATEAFIAEYCNSCPVADQCLDFAVRTDSVGVWGGIELTPRKLARLQRLRNAEGPVTVDRAKEVLDESG